MPAPTLLASALLAYGSAAGFLLIAYLTLRGGEGGGAKAAFAVFWTGSAAVALAQGTRSLAASGGIDSFALIRALDQTATPAYCLAAAGLLYYVLYLLTGRARLLVPVTVYYLALVPALRYAVESARPIGYEVREWQVNLVYATPLQTPYFTVVLALVALPVIAAVLAYGVVAIRLAPRSTRFRVACVALGLAVWLSAELAAWSSGLASTTWGELARRGAGLLVCVVVLMGYLPPAPARRRWGATPIGE